MLRFCVTAHSQSDAGAKQQGVNSDHAEDGESDDEQPVEGRNTPTSTCVPPFSHDGAVMAVRSPKYMRA